MRHLRCAEPIVGVLAVVIIAFASVALAGADSLDGYWKSDGYGILLEIDGDAVKASEITAISCLPVFTAKRQAEPPDGALALFTVMGEPVLMRPGSSADHKFFGFKGAASSIGFRRLGQRPAICDAPVANTPLANFDVFWTTFNEHYPFFALHGVDWQKLRDEYRPKITDATSEEELFGVFRAMVEPLEDAHVSIAGASTKQRFGGRRKNTERLDDAASRRAKEIIESNYLHGKLENSCNGQLSYGLLPDSIGYLRITAYSGYSLARGFDSESKALESALDKALQNADQLRGMIVDVRINRGGSDVLGVAVASRLAPQDYLAFAKKARNDPSDPNRFTELQDTQVLASAQPHFHGKVVLLTGGNTVSAGETFTMALMGRTPHVTRVGDNTQGVFSDVLGRKLPNGFRFGLPNEVFVTKDGLAFDGPGIPPHVAVPVFPKEDLRQGRDGALEKAIEIVRQK
jgi:Peptidase family S41/Tricorn protease C1 domain